MSSLVSDFIINPVLRQARRFSRSSQPEEHVDSITNQRIPRHTSHETTIDDISERLEGLSGQEDSHSGSSQTLSGAVLTSSPIEEDGGLEAELGTREYGRTSSAPVGPGPSHIESRRMASLRSEFGTVDDDMSDNPLFGIPGRFRTDSMTSNITNAISARMSPAEGPSRRSTQEQNAGNRQRNSILPEDDGMGLLRQQIVAIQSMDISPSEKARLMHRLLTKGYSQTQESFSAKPNGHPHSPESMISQERPTTPSSLSSFIWQMNGAAEGTAPNQQHTFHLSPDDMKPTYAPLDLTELDEDGDVRVKEDEPSLGCRHYKRNVKLQCSTCDQWYTCRLCHDEVENHILIRKETKNMLCMICGCAQRAGEFCVGCGERTAWYYCDVCKLWDNDSNKSIYHCIDCGICRKGRGLGRDFFHCKTCGTCMSMSVEQSHKCIERVSDCDCPICGEYMFTSPAPVVFMLCGHGIHKACYDEHMKSSYKCPICSKSTVNMESQFRNLDRAIDSQPMPPQFRDTKAMVSCNDCYAKSAVTYHWLGLKCAICDSYNTVQLSILSDPAVEISPPEMSETTQPTPVLEGTIGESSSLTPRPGPVRHRRHSSHMQVPSGSLGINNRFSPYHLPQRIGRSVSPVNGLEFFLDPPHSGTEDAMQEDDLDFWGRDEPRTTRVDDNDDAVGSDDDSEEDSTMDDCDDEDGEEDDRFELFGHR